MKCMARFFRLVLAPVCLQWSVPVSGNLHVSPQSAEKIGPDHELSCAFTSQPIAIVREFGPRLLQPVRHVGNEMDQALHTCFVDDESGPVVIATVIRLGNKGEAYDGITRFLA